VGWYFLTQSSPSEYDATNNDVLHLKGSVTKADRLPSWLRNKAIDDLPFYATSENETSAIIDGEPFEEVDEELEAARLWASHAANNKHDDNNNATEANQSQHPIIDVLSVGSSARIDYMNAQRDTWANNKHYVRDIFMESEMNTDSSIPDNGGSCQVLANECAESESSRLFSGQPTTFAETNSTTVAVNGEHDLCLQRRMGLAIGATARRYRKIVHALSIESTKSPSLTILSTGWEQYAGKILPNYLIVTFDVTYYNTLQLEQCITSKTDDEDKPLVYAPFISWSNREPSYNSNNNESQDTTKFAFPAQRTGAVFNRASLERFARPISCYASEDGTKPSIPIHYDPLEHPLEHRFCQWMAGKAKNVFSSLLHGALQLDLVRKKSKSEGDSLQPMSISDLLVMYSSHMHVLCKRDAGLPSGEEMLGYLVHKFSIGSRGDESAASSEGFGEIRTGTNNDDATEDICGATATKECDPSTMLACANLSLDQMKEVTKGGK
jgi:hypothetical protein